MKPILMAFLTSALFLGCSVSVDIANLRFQPAEGSDVKVTDTSPANDVAPPPEVVVDATPADLPPEVVTGANCWDVYDCLIFDKKGWDLAANDFKACGAVYDGDDLVGPVGELEHCLDTCMSTESIEQFATCLGAFCIAESIVCINDGQAGDKSCADALYCSVQECSATADQPAENGLECLLDCYGGMAPGEVDELTAVVHECVKKPGDENPLCLPTAQHCFADSGPANKSCWDVADCLNNCSSCDEADPDCHPETCLVDCFWGMSQIAYEDYSALSECFTDPYANVFSCLEGAVACFSVNFSDNMMSWSCGDMVEKIRQLYYAPDFGLADRYNQMLGVIWKLNIHQVPPFEEALHCLEEKWEVFPGYGEIPETHFDECAMMCPPP